MNIYENLERTDLEGELWKKYPIFPRYSVSNLGRFRNDETGRILKQYVRPGKN